MDGRSIEVNVHNIENNPHCFHGPTLLFKRFKGKTKEYYACSACRNRKDCNFYVPVNSRNSKRNASEHWKEQQALAILSVKKLKPYKKYLKIVQELESQVESTSNIEDHNIEKNQDCKNQKRVIKKKVKVQANYCCSCECLFDNTDKNHSECKVISNLTHYQLTHPTEILIPKVDAKTHAQYFFSKTSVEDIVLLLKRLKVTKVLCIGTPRIHECILNEHKISMKSLLLDLDRNYYNFYSKNEFIWYNMFNNYMFDTEQQQVLLKFLRTGKVVVLMDPPFGGRVEPLAYTLNKLSQTFSDVNDHNNSKKMLETFWFFPYFMEQHVVGSLPNFKMFDYKVNYENHSSFTNEGSKKRKLGSPVRIFTNIPLSQLDLEGVSGYKFCSICGYWVSSENKHCDKCKTCTSKNGKTYVHCSKCAKCVKPSYEHCDTCLRCCLRTHVCGEFQPDSNCFHCGRPGHKKRECPQIIGGKKKSFSISLVPKKKRRFM